MSTPTDASLQAKTQEIREEPPLFPPTATSSSTQQRLDEPPTPSPVEGVHQRPSKADELKRKYDKVYHALYYLRNKEKYRDYARRYRAAKKGFRFIFGDDCRTSRAAGSQSLPDEYVAFRRLFKMVKLKWYGTKNALVFRNYSRNRMRLRYLIHRERTAQLRMMPVDDLLAMVQQDE